MSQDAVVLTAARRTPIGSFQGSLSPVKATDLAAAAIQACVSDTGLDPEEIKGVLLGCVLSAGLGQAPARQAALAAGLPFSVGGTTVNKVCGSGMMATMIAHDRIRAGSRNVVITGGMESMSNAPYLLPKARAGYRMGHQEVLDHMFFDGLQNAYDGNLMGHFADQTAKAYGFSREDQDAFATESVKRALAAIANGAFADELAPVNVKKRKRTTVIDQDEEPGRCDIARIPTMRPAFSRDGTVTAASSSTIADGAATLMMMTERDAARRNIEPLARIAGFRIHSQEPEWFTTAPGPAVKALLEKLAWKPDDVDLYEINEAFACVTMAAMRDLGLEHDRVNVNGGACALGHPIGATGARIVVTLVHALRKRGAKRGIATQCIGGGEAVAIAVEVR